MCVGSNGISLLLPVCDFQESIGGGSLGPFLDFMDVWNQVSQKRGWHGSFGAHSMDVLHHHSAGIGAVLG